MAAVDNGMAASFLSTELRPLAIVDILVPEFRTAQDEKTRASFVEYRVDCFHPISHQLLASAWRRFSDFVALNRELAGARVAVLNLPSKNPLGSVNLEERRIWLQCALLSHVQKEKALSAVFKEFLTLPAETEHEEPANYRQHAPPPRGAQSSSQASAVRDIRRSAGQVSATGSQAHLPRRPELPLPINSQPLNIDSGKEQQEIVVTFRPGGLGITSIWKSGFVEDVDEGSQAQLLGVKSGMYFKTIDNLAYSEDLLDRSIAGKSSYEVGFSFSPADVAAQASAALASSVATAAGIVADQGRLGQQLTWQCLWLSSALLVVAAWSLCLSQPAISGVESWSPHWFWIRPFQQSLSVLHLSALLLLGTSIGLLIPAAASAAFKTDEARWEAAAKDVEIKAADLSALVSSLLCRGGDVPELAVSVPVSPVRKNSEESLPHNLKEVSARNVELLNQHLQPGFNAYGKAWEVTKKNNGLEVHAGKIPSESRRVWKSTFTVESSATMEQIIEELMDWAKRPKWDSGIEVGEVLRRFPDGYDVITYGSAKVLTVSARRFLNLNHVQRSADGQSFIIAFCSIPSNALPGLPGEQKGIVQGETKPGCGTRWSLLPSDGNSTQKHWKVETVVEVDPKGWIPTSVINTAMTKQLTDNCSDTLNYFRSLQAA